MTILQAYNIKKSYQAKELIIPVINGIDMEIKQGEFIAVCGSSGSGKSTLLYLLSGVEKLSDGKVEFYGRDLSTLKEKEIARIRRQEMAFIYQFYNLIPNLNVEDNITLVKRMDKRLSDDDEDYFFELVKLAGIEKLVYRLPNELSGGEQQRVALIRALFASPKIIFADEPTGNLDSKSSAEVMDLFATVNHKYKTAIVMVTHSAAQAQLAERIITLKDGQLKNDSKISL